MIYNENKCECQCVKGHLECSAQIWFSCVNQTNQFWQIWFCWDCCCFLIFCVFFCFCLSLLFNNSSLKAWIPVELKTTNNQNRKIQIPSNFIFQENCFHWSSLIFVDRLQMLSLSLPFLDAAITLTCWHNLFQISALFFLNMTRTKLPLRQLLWGNVLHPWNAKYICMYEINVDEEKQEIDTK